MSLGIIILAAGQSRRMRGGDKLLETVQGQPLLRRIQQAAAATGCPVWVALPGPSHPRAAHLLPASQPVYVPDAALGLSASIRRAVAALPLG
ncbi:MAG: nucleotidyltransferase family protein, partial [Lutimaribacter sp.]